MVVLLLLVFAFFAGLVDAIVGGGGLIQIPALLILRPDLPIATLFGTNKVASLFGTAAAVKSYASRVTLPKTILLPATASAFICSFLGAKTVTYVDPNFLRPLILILLVAITIYTFKKKNLGEADQARLAPEHVWAGALGTGAILGFYDGFFGPGTGSFLLFAFVSLFGLNFIAASASAKVVNLSTNIAAFVSFALGGHVHYSLAFPMAACNVAGSYAGSKLALRLGTPFVRKLFLVVLVGIIGRLAYDLLK